MWHHRAVMPIVKFRKLSWALLLPFLLLFAQQGELFHEYSHYSEPQRSQKKAPADSDHCPQCLAYAHLAGAAGTALFAAALLADLAFHFAPALIVASADREAAAPRSRGPPSI